MPEAIDTDVLIVGEGLGAWVCAREIARRGKSVVVVPGPAAPPLVLPHVRSHRPVGPRPSYVQAVAEYGREAARVLWEAFREDGDEVGRLAVDLSLSAAVERGGGFVLARTREEALDLAEGEDLLREDAFSGEFLDHYLLEARFDVSGLAAGYWAVDDLTLDEVMLVSALREQSGAVRTVPGPPLRLDPGLRVTVETERARIQAECVILAVADPRALPGVKVSSVFHDVPWTRSETALPAAVLLPCPARSWDGGTWWRRFDGGLSTLAAHPDGLGPPDWVATETRPPTRTDRDVAAASRDGLPVIGQTGDAPVFLLHGGSGLGTACAVAGARWVTAAILDGHDACPAPLRAGRFCP